jgi:predicted alpha/beta superfamily hydrolase
VSDWQRYEDVHGRDHTVSGRVVVWRQLASPQLGGARDILAYLPPSLGDRRDPGRRYPVIYFHDGQNVFDERTSFSGEWQADETLEQLAGEGLEAIAVAIPNGGDARMDEYNPWRDTRRRMGGKGDAYLEWVVGHVKPLVDRTLPTAPGRATTGICGSSMGGLISLYAMTAHPDVFGLAAAMSPSLSWNDHRMVELVREGRLPPARIHLDAGGREWRGMLAEARRLRDLLLEKGFVDGRDLQYVEERFGTHRESAWARRLPAALRFLLAETHVPDAVPTR